MHAWGNLETPGGNNKEGAVKHNGSSRDDYSISETRQRGSKTYGRARGRGVPSSFPDSGALGDGTGERSAAEVARRGSKT